jgi:hypothetical protein
LELIDCLREATQRIFKITGRYSIRHKRLVLHGVAICERNQSPHEAIHVPLVAKINSARFGIDPQTLISLLTLSEDALAKLVSIIGVDTLRKI